MKVALFGYNGYIGSLVYNFLKKYSTIELTCYSKNIKLNNNTHIYSFTKEEINTYDVIIYMAGICKKKDIETLEYENIYNINVNELLNIVKNMNDNQVCIYSSTASLYINNNQYNISKENDDINKSILNKYELSMYEREIQINKLNKKTIGLRMGSVIGLSKNMKLDMLYNALYYQALFTNNINIWGAHNYRSILWYQDLLNIIYLIIQNKDSIKIPEIYNIGSFNITIYDAANYIKDKLNINTNILNNNISTLGFQIDSMKICKQFNYNMVGTPEIIHNFFINNKYMFTEIINNSINIDTKNCIICNNNIELIVSLDKQPLANCLLSTEEKDLDKYLLELYRCKRCNHTQLGYFIDREILFKHYLYESGTSNTAKKYFLEFAKKYTDKYNYKNDKSVFEIACNDGSQLDAFLELGWKTYGIDPAQNIVIKARKKGHNILCEYWGNYINTNLFKDITFDLIVAQNVFAHVINPIDFLKNCVDIMNDNTLLVIQTSQANMYKNNEFDTIYHEHVSFFTIKSMKYAVESVGCYLKNVYKTNIHGISYVFEIMKGSNIINLPLLENEINDGLYEDKLYIDYKFNIHNIKNIVINILNTYKDNKYNIIGYGAAAKGNVFLNYIFESKKHRLAPECIIDEAILKINKYTPCIKIPIKDINILNNYNNKKVLIIILAWNFADEIINKLKSYIKINNIIGEFEYIYFFPKIYNGILHS